MILVIAAACGAGESQDRGSGAVADALATAEVQGWSAHASLLADGELTLADLDAAWQMYGDCIRAGGGEVTEASLDLLDSRNYGGDTMRNGLSVPAFDALLDECQPPFNVLASTYVSLGEPHLGADVAGPLVECLVAAGLDVEDVADAERLVYEVMGASSHPSAELVDGCVRQVLAR
ncbi:MAG: hypothetical protein AB7L84_07635 [Acidimicrobiia bacterium]